MRVMFGAVRRVRGRAPLLPSPLNRPQGKGGIGKTTLATSLGGRSAATLNATLILIDTQVNSVFLLPTACALVNRRRAVVSTQASLREPVVIDHDQRMGSRGGR